MNGVCLPVLSNAETQNASLRIPAVSSRLLHPRALQFRSNSNQLGIYFKPLHISFRSLSHVFTICVLDFVAKYWNQYITVDAHYAGITGCCLWMSVSRLYSDVLMVF